MTTERKGLAEASTDKKGDTAMTGHAVVIAGAGPTGLMLAGELVLAGVDVAVVERRANQDLGSMRGRGLHSRTIEILDQRGIADRFLSRGKTAQGAHFSWIPLDISDFPTRHPYALGLGQQATEHILAEWVDELAVPVYRGREVTGFSQDDDAVSVELSDGPPLRAEYLVGCDGGRSLIRKACGIEFAGWGPSESYLVAEVEMTQEPNWGTHRDDKGTHSLRPMEGGKRVRVMVTESNVRPSGEATLSDLSEALIAVQGTDYGMHSPTSITRFTDVTRQAVTYRDRRVLLAGDAAHVQPPIGGQGLNTGLQDAVNLGWKLAQVIKGISPTSLLDTYQAERHPVSARTMRNTMAQTELLRSEPGLDALRDTLSELLSLDEGRKRFGAMISGLDIRYDLGAEGHPLAGDRMPDLDLVTASGPVRVFTLLHEARPLLLNFGDPGAFDITPWADRVRLIDAKCAGSWELPVVGTVSAPAAVLVRPDGHIAWAADGPDLEPSEALTKWFGPPAAA